MRFITHWRLSLLSNHGVVSLARKVRSAGRQGVQHLPVGGHQRSVPLPEAVIGEEYPWSDGCGYVRSERFIGFWSQVRKHARIHTLYRRTVSHCQSHTVWLGLCSVDGLPRQLSHIIVFILCFFAY
jgi:hypothetical protein